MRGKRITLPDLSRLKRDLPIEIGNMSKNHFLRGFEKGGGQTDQSIGGWAPRKTQGTGRALLVKTGALRADIKVRERSFNRIRISTASVPYGGYHNYGSGKLTQREFLGESSELDRMVIRKIESELDKLFKR